MIAKNAGQSHGCTRSGSTTTDEERQKGGGEGHTGAADSHGLSLWIRASGITGSSDSSRLTRCCTGRAYDWSGRRCFRFLANVAVPVRRPQLPPRIDCGIGIPDTESGTGFGSLPPRGRETSCRPWPLSFCLRTESAVVALKTPRRARGRSADWKSTCLSPLPGRRPVAAGSSHVVYYTDLRHRCSSCWR